MNLVDVSIVEILEEPRQRVDNEYCCWEVKVLTNCYGAKKEKIFRAVSKHEIDRYKIGYVYSE